MKWPFVWRRDYAELQDVVRDQARALADLEADLTRLRARVERIAEPAPVSPPPPPTPEARIVKSVRDGDAAFVQRMQAKKP